MSNNSNESSKYTAYKAMDRYKTNHILHLLLSIITFGFWIIVWTTVSASNTIERNKIARANNLAEDSNLFVYLSIFMILLIIIVYIRGGQHKQNEIDVQILEKPPQAKAANTWEYWSTPDEMGRGEIKYASIESDDIVEFDFPYNGKQSPTLYIRKNHDDKIDVFIFLDKAHFLCRHDDCSLLAKFDENKPVRFEASESKSAETNIIFVNDANNFLTKLKKSNKLSIESIFYKEGKRVFNFNTEKLNWHK